MTGRVPDDRVINFEHCKSHYMCVDILTKEIKIASLWFHALSLIGIRPKGAPVSWGRMAEPIKKKKKNADPGVPKCDPADGFQSSMLSVLKLAYPRSVFSFC